MNNITYEQKKAVGLKFILDNLCPVSAYGIEKAKKLGFYLPAQLKELDAELDNVQKACDTLEKFENEYAELTHTLSCANNIIKTINKCAVSPLDDVELFEIKVYLLLLIKIKKSFDKINKTANFTNINFSDLTKALNIVDPEKNRIATFYVPSSLSPKLDELRQSKTKIEQQLSVTAKNATNSLVEKHTELAKQEEAEENRLRAVMSAKLSPYAEQMRKNADTIANLDLIIAKAKLAKKYGGIKPDITTHKKITAKDVFNPMIAENLKERNALFTPISLTVESGATVITGANMGGKSVALKTLALNVLLAQMGFFVFGQKFSMPLFDFCSLAVTDTERTDRGLSSFGGEIARLNESYKKTKLEFGLIIIDELAKGTNAVEGQEIFAASTQALNDKDSISVLTTHYDGVARYANRHYQVLGLQNLDEYYIPSKNIDENIQYLAKKMNYGLKEVSLFSYAPKEAFSICVALGLDSEILDKIKIDH